MIPKSRSPSPSKLNTSRQRSSTPAKRMSIPQMSPNTENVNTRAAESDIDQLLFMLKANKQTMTDSLELFQIISTNKMPQRCITHNNNISLYCLNEHKLLCVNCVYNENKHKSHKIIPSQTATTEIKKDNLSSLYKTSQNLSGIEENQRYLSDQVEKCIHTKTRLLKVLEKQFDEIMRIMSNKYLELKLKVIDKFEESMKRNHSLLKQFSDLKDSIDNNMKLVQERQQKSDEQILKHLMLEKIVQCSTLKEKIDKRKSNSDIIEQHSLNQMSKLREYVIKHKWGRF